MQDRPPSKLKSDPRDPDMEVRYGPGIVLPFAVLSFFIFILRIVFWIVKPKSTLVQVKEGKKR